MRLTLRTMLAYMDDILEPEDAELISKKIEESEFATTLLHRTRDVMRRLRLGSPDVTDRRAGLDANTVAEYLDNTLESDRVLDFEKVCLESDVHLAEVASCHQILTLVLGEPVDVDVASRQRMYRLPDLIQAQVRAATEAADLPPAGPDADLRSKAKPSGKERSSRPGRTAAGVPEWLAPRRGRRRWWWAAAGVGLALVCVLVVLAFSGWSPIGSLLGLGRPDQPVAQVPGRGPAEGKPPAEAAPGDAERPAPDRRASPDVPAAIPGETPGVVGPKTQTPRVGPVADMTKRPTEPQPEAAPGVERGPGAVGPDAKSARPSESPLAQPPIADLAKVPTDVPAGPGLQPGEQTPDQTAVEPRVDAAPLPPEAVGQLDSPTQVLLQLDEEGGSPGWRRVGDQADLMPQTTYLSLPPYRPSLRLQEQMRVLLVDGAQIKLLAPDQEGVVGLAVELGRIRIDTLGQEGCRLRLQVAGRSGTAIFGDAQSGLAVEVSRAPGSHADPETQPAPLTTDLYATSGKILWQDGANRQPLTVHASVRLRLNEQPLEAEAVQDFPKWIVADTMSLLDQRASATIERGLEPGRPVILGLRELAEHRHREVRWLAVRCLGFIGDFRLMVEALDDPNERSAWLDQVDELRTAVRRSPVAAAQVRAAMEKLHGQEGARLYQMLWKYPEDRLGEEEAAQLVADLDHDTLAFRRLSFWNLCQLTRGATFAYKPEDIAPKRLPAVRKWKERLSSGLLPRPEAPGDQQAPPKEESPSVEELLPGMKR